MQGQRSEQNREATRDVSQVRMGGSAERATRQPRYCLGRGCGMPGINCAGKGGCSIMP